MEIHHKISNPQLRKNEEKISDQSLSRLHAESAPKLYNHHSSKNISHLGLIEVVNEVNSINQSAMYEQ